MYFTTLSMDEGHSDFIRGAKVSILISIAIHTVIQEEDEMERARDKIDDGINKYREEKYNMGWVILMRAIHLFLIN